MSTLCMSCWCHLTGFLKKWPLLFILHKPAECSFHTQLMHLFYSSASSHWLLHSWSLVTQNLVYFKCNVRMCKTELEGREMWRNQKTGKWVKCWYGAQKKRIWEQVSDSVAALHSFPLASAVKLQCVCCHRLPPRTAIGQSRGHLCPLHQPLRWLLIRSWDQ